jgi:hypothetical protein
VDFDRDPIPQLDRLAGFGFNQLGKHRHCFEQAEAVPHDHPRLPAVRRDDHDDADLTGCQIGAPVFEGGQEHCDCRQYEAFAGAATAHEPGFQQRLTRWCATSRKLAINLELFLRHWQTEQGCQKHAPCLPRIDIAKEVAKHLRVVQRVKNIHALSLGAGGVFQGIGGDIPRPALQAYGFQQAPEAVGRTLIQIELVRLRRTCSRKLDLHPLQFNGQRRYATYDGSLGL